MPTSLDTQIGEAQARLLAQPLSTYQKLHSWVKVCAATLVMMLLLYCASDLAPSVCPRATLF